MSVHRFFEPDAAAAAEACSHHILSCLEQALAGHEIATMAVSGGNSPKPIFAALARADFDWRRVHLFWADERCVPPQHEDSNYRMVDENFIIPARFSRRNVHRVYTELGPERAAERYAEDIRHLFEIGDDAVPAFDLLHLGMGPDGHIASLFPGDPLIEDRDRITAATYVTSKHQWRVTIMPAVILNARHTVVYAPGEDKAAVTRAVFEDGFDAMRIPAHIPAHLARSVTWFSDQASARQETLSEAG
ncbi:MAG: 6-phosphogluconolactonase [Bryobacteraceae bacterium]